MLIVSDFPEVPQPVIHRHVSDNATLSWDLSAVRRLHDIEHEILLTTPLTGKLHLDYYIEHWLSLNSPPRHSVPRPTDHLRPTVVIDNLTPGDAGTYAVDIILTSSAHRWVNYSSRFITELIVISDTDSAFESRGYLDAIIALSVFFGISLVVTIVLIIMCKRYRDSAVAKIDDIQADSMHSLPWRQGSERHWGDEDEHSDHSYDDANQTDIDISERNGHNDAYATGTGENQQPRPSQLYRNTTLSRTLSQFPPPIPPKIF